MSDTTTTDLSNYTDARQARGLDRILDDLASLSECPAHVARQIEERTYREPQYKMPPSDADFAAAEREQIAWDERNMMDRFE